MSELSLATFREEAVGDVDDGVFFASTTGALDLFREDLGRQDTQAGKLEAVVRHADDLGQIVHNYIVRAMAGGGLVEFTADRILAVMPIARDLQQRIMVVLNKLYEVAITVATGSTFAAVEMINDEARRDLEEIARLSDIAEEAYDDAAVVASITGAEIDENDKQVRRLVREMRRAISELGG